MRSAAPSPANPTTDEEQVSRVRRAITHLGRRLRQEASGGVTPSQLAVLVSLDKRGPLTLGELAAEEHISAPAASRTVRSLEDEKLVTREVVADDRRAATLSLTPRAERMLQGIRHQRNAWLAAQMSRLTPRQLAELERGIDVIESILENRETVEEEPGR